MFWRVKNGWLSMCSHICLLDHRTHIHPNFLRFHFAASFFFPARVFRFMPIRKSSDSWKLKTMKIFTLRIWERISWKFTDHRQFSYRILRFSEYDFCCCFWLHYWKSCLNREKDTVLSEKSSYWESRKKSVYTGTWTHKPNHHVEKDFIYTSDEKSGAHALVACICVCV